MKSLTPWRFSLFIGARYTGARKKSQLVSFLSAVSMAGLVVGVGLLIAVLSVMNGFDRDLREKILGLVPQAAIYHYSAIDDWPSLVDRIEESDGVIAAAPFIQVNALASVKKETAAILLYGIDVQREQKVSLLNDYIRQDSLQKLEGKIDTVILGHGIAQRLQVTEGDRTMLVAPSRTAESTAPHIAYFTVVDIIQSNTELDEVLALTSLDTAAKLAGTAGQVDGIRLKLDDLFQAPTIAFSIVASLSPGYYQTNWTRTHGNLYYAIQMSKNMVGLLMSLIVAIAAFNVISTLIMVVTDKRGDIAILRTLGASSRVILLTFLCQGCLIGVTGIAIGVVLGCGLSLGLQRVVQFIERIFNVQFLHSDVYPLTYLPTEIRWDDIVQVVCIAMLLVLIAAIYPAWRATKIAPAEALRYE